MQRSLRTLPFLGVLLLLGGNALAQAGANDPSFNPGTGADSDVRSITAQPDGNIIIGGYFMEYDGIVRQTIERIHADGSPDDTFDPGTGTSGYLYCSTLQPDGKIIIGGGYGNYNNLGAKRVMRLNADGSVDTSFDPGPSTPNGGIRAVEILSDGKIIVAGAFYIFNGTPMQRIARLHADGSLDMGFDPGSVAAGDINAIALAPDGTIIIVGGFLSVDGVSRNRIARLHADGSLDTGFDPGTGVENVLHSTAIQADGKILIGGTFHAYNGQWVVNIIQLNADGSLDPGFDPGLGADNTVYVIKVLSDGKILIGGDFTSYNGIGRNRIARLNADGSLDTSFDPGAGADSTVRAIEVLFNGKIMIGGAFTSYDGADRAHIALLLADGTADIDEAKPSASSDLQLWPNPNDGEHLFLTLDGLERSLRSVDAKIIDATGRVVLAENIQVAGGELHTSLHLDQVANGVYWMHLIAGERTFSRRVVVGR